MTRLTDALASGAFVSNASQRTSTAQHYRIALAMAVVLAAVTAFAVGQDAASAQAVQAAGPELTRVLRFMAAVKAILALAASWLAWWRLGYPATPRLAVACIAACALMAAGPGLIWSMEHAALGAVMVHAGLLLMLILGWADRAGLQEVATSAGRRRAARRGPGSPPVSAS